MAIALKRVYEKPSRTDGARVLVDRLWPRGLTKDDAQIKIWLKDIAPSNELRKWYHARPTQWTEFRRKYLEELNDAAANAALEQLYALAAERPKVTLLFGSRNLERNNATVLKELMDGSRKPPSTSGAVRVSASRRARAKVSR